MDLLHKHRFGQFDAPQRVVPDIPLELDKIVCGLLEKEPAGRPANGQILQRQLEVLRSKMERREQHTIVFDHLVAPTAFYISREEFESWWHDVPASDVEISWHNKNSWRGQGRLD